MALYSSATNIGVHGQQNQLLPHYQVSVHPVPSLFVLRTMAPACFWTPYVQKDRQSPPKLVPQGRFACSCSCSKSSPVAESGVIDNDKALSHNAYGSKG
jgi:hypothetical protein